MFQNRRFFDMITREESIVLACCCSLFFLSKLSNKLTYLLTVFRVASERKGFGAESEAAYVNGAPERSNRERVLTTRGVFFSLSFRRGEECSMWQFNMHTCVQFAKGYSPIHNQDQNNYNTNARMLYS